MSVLLQSARRAASLRAGFVPELVAAEVEWLEELRVEHEAATSALHSALAAHDELVAEQARLGVEFREALRAHVRGDADVPASLDRDLAAARLQVAAEDAASAALEVCRVLRALASVCDSRRRELRALAAEPRLVPTSEEHRARRPLVQAARVFLVRVDPSTNVRGDAARLRDEAEALVGERVAA